MKTKNVGMALLVTILLLCSSVIFAGPQPSQPHAANAMWVEPSPIVFNTMNASIGTKFNVSIWLNMTENIFAYQIGLHYNRTQLMCTRAAYTAGNTSDYFRDHTTVSPAPAIDESELGNGSILAFETVLGYDFIPGPHSGSLIWAEFEVMTVPASGNLASKFDIGSEYPTRTWVRDPNKNKLFFTSYDANYQFIGPPLILSVSISANSTSIRLGQPVLFTSTVSGGSPPYTYQWFLNSAAVLGANTSSWTYTPTTDISCAVYLNVTDSEATTAQSNIITLMAPSAGGGSRMPYKY
jgi:hypothetical protein